MNQLLTEMDGFAEKKTVFFIGATNRPDILDPALIRPGRLDQLIYIPMPDYESRHAILRATLRRTPISDDVDLAYLAAKTDKFSGADLAEICQTACKLAIREDIAREASLDCSESLDGDQEFLPELLPRHFTEAVRLARRSVSDRDLALYASYAKSLGKGDGRQPLSLANFAFPRHSNEDELQHEEEMDEDDLYS